MEEMSQVVSNVVNVLSSVSKWTQNLVDFSKWTQNLNFVELKERQFVGFVLFDT